MRNTKIALSSVVFVAALVWAGSASALNPQPEPPREHPKNVQLQNMQTEPPDPCLAAQTLAMDKHLAESEKTRQLNAAALACSRKGHQLNPQPLPPG